MYARPYLEQYFQKPSGFVALNRSFFPATTTQDVQQLAHAKDNSARGAPTEKVNDMIQLQKEIYRIAGDVANSKLKILVLDRAKEMEVMYAGRVATTSKDLQKAWCEEAPTEAVAKKFFHIYFSVKDEPRTWARLIFAVANELMIWCPVEDKNLDYCSRGKKGQGPKAHAFATLISNKFRDNHRNPVFRKPPHGISLTVSNGGRKGRREKVFVFAENVSGWNTDLHKAFVDSKPVSI